MRWRTFFSAPIDGRSVVRILAALSFVGAAAGGSVVLFGLYDVSAKSGHWPGVSWVLHSTFRNSVALRADADPPPHLMDDGMVALGAGHFDSACRHCHASPGETRSASVRAMLPEPPHITDAVSDWQPDELHWIVHNGIKMTGMPAWPAEREDDVWPVVAFLRSVDGMSVADYRNLTRKAGESSCAMCHGENGVSDNPHVPRLDILSETYIANSLRAYLRGSRDSGIMAEAMDALPEDAIADVARRLSRVAPEGPARKMGDLAQRGRALATERGTVEVPACRACHGPWPEPLNPAFPSLAGQHAPYLETQLRLWRDGDRGGGAAAKLMHHAARDLTEEDIAALAAYYSGLKAAKLDETRE